MWYLLIPVAFIAGGWIFGARKVLSNAPPLPHDAPPPSPQPPQFTPGIIDNPLLIPQFNVPPSPSGPTGPIQVGDTVIVDIEKAGNLPPGIPPGVIPMFVMSFDVPDDTNKEMFMGTFVRPEMMALFGPQPVRRAAARKA